MGHAHSGLSGGPPDDDDTAWDQLQGEADIAHAIKRAKKLMQRLAIPNRFHRCWHHFRKGVVTIGNTANSNRYEQISPEHLLKVGEMLVRNPLADAQLWIKLLKTRFRVERCMKDNQRPMIQRGKKEYEELRHLKWRIEEKLGEASIFFSS